MSYNTSLNFIVVIIDYTLFSRDIACSIIEYYFDYYIFNTSSTILFTFRARRVITVSNGWLDIIFHFHFIELSDDVVWVSVFLKPLATFQLTQMLWSPLLIHSAYTYKKGASLHTNKFVFWRITADSWSAFKSGVDSYFHFLFFTFIIAKGLWSKAQVTGRCGRHYFLFIYIIYIKYGYGGLGHHWICYTSSHFYFSAIAHIYISYLSYISSSSWYYVPRHWH